MRFTAVTLMLTAGLVLIGFAATPVAVVNDQPITQEELQRATQMNQVIYGIYQQFPTFAESLLTTEEGERLLERYERDMLERLIEQTLQQQEAERRGITPDEAEVQEWVDETIVNVKRQNQMTEDELIAALSQQGRTLEDFRAEIAEDVREHLMTEVLIEEVTDDVTVSAAEVRAYYDEHPDRFRDDEGELVAFEEVQDAIASELLEGAQQEAWHDWLSELREQAEITVNL